MRGIRGATQSEIDTVRAMNDGDVELCRALTTGGRLDPEAKALRPDLHE